MTKNSKIFVKNLTSTPENWRGALNACIKKYLHEGFLGEELNDIALTLCSNIENELDDPRVSTGIQLQRLKTAFNAHWALLC